MTFTRFAKYAWLVLIYNLLVVLWGAYVRATGSGAGCGNHWPLCDGMVIPRAPQVETLIELTHRLSSGLAFLLVLFLYIWGKRSFSKGHPVRLGVNYSLFFIITEALVGAGLVLFDWVAYNLSIERVISISIHLVNTFLLLGSLALTGWWASGGEKINLRGHGLAGKLMIVGMVGVLLIGVTGAITALGDTLFPAESLAQGLTQDFDPTAHFLIRLRFYHPLISVLIGVFLLFLAGLIALFRTKRTIRRLCAGLAGLLVVQWIAGIINLVLLAPVWMQLVHLLLADAVWICLILLVAANFGESELRHSLKPGIPVLVKMSKP